MVCATENLFNLSKLREIPQLSSGEYFCLVQKSGLEIRLSAVPISGTTAGAGCQQGTKPDHINF